MVTLPLLLALVVGAVVGLVLALITFVMWPKLSEMSIYQHPILFIEGTLPLLAGYTVWAWLEGVPDTALALWTIVIMAGAFDIATFAYHYWRDERHDRAEGGR